MHRVLLSSSVLVLSQLSKAITIVLGFTIVCLYFLSPFQSHFFIATVLICLVCSSVSLQCSFIIEVNPCYKWTDIIYHALAASALAAFSIFFIIGLEKLCRGDLTNTSNNIFGPYLPPLNTYRYGELSPGEAKIAGILGVLNGVFHAILVGLIALT